MNIVNKLTLRHLKQNMSRTVVTTLGICVSVAMITAVFVAMASFLNLFGEITVLSGGDYHAQFYNVSQEQLGRVEKDSRVSETGIYITPDNSSVQLENRRNDKLGTGEMLVGDETYFKQMITSDYDGALPKNENEVAVEQSFLEDNSLSLAVGDKISLEEGCRYIIENGNEMTVAGDYYYPNESFSSDGYKEYTITAILHNNPATRFVSVFRGMSSEEKSGIVCASIKLKELNYKSLNEINDIIKINKIEEYKINKDYLESVFAIDEDSVIASALIPMVAVILALIIIASVALIYNAFGMSLSERVRYLGMLASVGATRKQKKKSVYYEGVILGCIGIPVGIIAGIIGIGTTLKAIGNKIISTGMIAGVSDSNMQMKIVVPIWALIGIVFVSVFTIFISCFVPSKKASMITPIDAIRQRKEVRLKAKGLKSPKMIRKIFGYEGELAYKNLKRNGRKSRVITSSIALSIILFISCNYFCSMFTQANDMEMEMPYQVSAMVTYSEKEKFEKELDKLSDVKDYYTVNNAYFRCGKDINELKKNIESDEYLTTSYKKLFNSAIAFYVNIIDDEAFNKLCENNGIDYKSFYGDSVKGVLLNDITHKGSGNAVFNDKIIGQHLKSEEGFEMNGESVDIEIAGLVSYDEDDYVCSLSPKNCLAMYIPESQYFGVLRGDADDSNKSIMIGIETDKHKEVLEKVSEILEDGYSSTYAQDYVDMLQVMNSLVFIIQVFVYGFITLITLITIANIINTVSTNIQLRRKEFAMLKSVGTTPKGFRKMISLESVFYGIKAVIFGIPISVAISIGLNKIMASTSIPFIFDWKLYLIVIAVVFIIIGMTMLYAVSKLKDDSIVETLKEEIN